jgi:VWFA-related protein
MQPLISVAGGNYVLQSATAMQWRQWEDEIAVKPGLSAIALGALLTLSLSTVYTVRAQEQQSTVPDAPLPQAPPKLVGDGPITPGKGAGDSVQQPVTGNSASGSPATDQPTSSTSDQTAPAQQTGPVAKPAAPAPPPDILPAPGEGFDKTATTIKVEVNFVEVPVTVKDTKGGLVAGLTFRDFRVFENEVPEPLHLFTVDPFPLSIAFVIDQSLTADVMAKVNESMGAIQGALTPYDEAAVFTYGNGPKEWTGFTGAQGNRLPAVLALAKATGTDMQVPVNDGPFAGCSIRQNGNCIDPNLQPGRSAGDGSFITIPKEIHTLNDAILAAAKELSSRPKGRRRLIYVISDGKEFGSKATLKEVIRYLQTNKIAVYATGVGVSAAWGEGYVSRIHLPFTMYDNILYKYTAATGGDLDSERGVNGIEKSYAKIAEEARTQYTLGYLSHESIYNSKYRKIDVRVNRPGLEVIAKQGYYPSAQDK